MSRLVSETALRRLEQAKTRAAKGRGEQRRQFRELERIVDALEKGSGSLNQRATTLAALAVAALGALGIFATRLGTVHAAGFVIASAALLGVASIALLTAAMTAIHSTRPAGKWSENMALWAKEVGAGEMDKAGRLDHLTKTIKMQLQRNHCKARLMKRAYDGTGVALVAATLAVLMVVVDIAIY